MEHAFRLAREANYVGLLAHPNFPAGSSSAKPAAILSHATPQMAQRESQVPHWQSHNQSYSGPMAPMMTPQQVQLMQQMQMMQQMSMQPPPPQIVHGDMSRVSSSPLNSQLPLRNGGEVRNGGGTWGSMQHRDYPLEQAQPSMFPSGGVEGGAVESEVVEKKVGDKFLGMFV
jgi:hypothetical protein